MRARPARGLSLILLLQSLAGSAIVSSEPIAGAKPAAPALVDGATPEASTDEASTDEAWGDLEARPQRKKGWGNAFGVRLEAATLGEEPPHVPNMIGIGGTFRLTPRPYVGFEVGYGRMHGTDWNGRSRSDTVGSLSALYFFNPESPACVYVPVGFHVAMTSTAQQKHYGGGHVGLGVEVPISPSFTVNGELLGLLRSPVAKEDPESEGTDQARNVGGALLRLGLTLHL
jgi:hypothetical protein